MEDTESCALSKDLRTCSYSSQSVFLHLASFRFKMVICTDRSIYTMILLSGEGVN